MTDRVVAPTEPADPAPAVRSRWQSLEFNSTALMAAGLINSALGLVFWALAARFFVGPKWAGPEPSSTPR